MEISPGVELIWSLASREAMLAKVREVEPDHFFCALLKYAEFNNLQLGELKVPSLVLFALIAERDQLKSELKQNNLQTEVRKQIRSRLGQGSYQAKPDEILHRAEESRQLFVKASERKRGEMKAEGRIDAIDILQVLLQKPTRNMIDVLGQPVIRAVITSQERGKSVLNQYAQEASQAPSGMVGKKLMPQIQILAWAMQSIAKAPLLLICEPGVEAKPIIQSAVQKQISPPKLHIVNLHDVFRDAKKDELFLSHVANILDEAGDKPEHLLYLDAVKLTDLVDSLSAIKSSLTKKSFGLILTVSAQAYSQVKEQDSTVDNLYRVIWLHDLEHVSRLSKV